jgi:hypothetical protein
MNKIFGLSFKEGEKIDPDGLTVDKIILLTMKEEDRLKMIDWYVEYEDPEDDISLCTKWTIVKCHYPHSPEPFIIAFPTADDGSIPDIELSPEFLEEDWEEVLKRVEEGKIMNGFDPYNEGEIE